MCIFHDHFFHLQNYHVLPNSDLALYHSTEGGMVGLFHCVASFGSNSVTIAAYTVVEGG